MSLLHVRRLLAATRLAMVAFPLTTALAFAQTGTISGKVTEAAGGAPLENAQIQVQAGTTNFGAVSGANGVYRAVNVPAGSYTVTVKLLGYLPRTLSGIKVTSGGTTTLDLLLTASVVQLNQTVVTASRNVPEKALDAPASISVISSERIEEKPAITIADHLRSTPGVDIIKGGIAQSNIVARGFNNAFSGSMLVLQDYRFAGVPSLRVNVPFLMTGTNEDVDRIEVLLGPASALYGPNSANGVLHVITKSPFASQGTTASIDGGERSVIRAGLRHAGVVNEKFAYKLSGEYMQGKDWEYNDLAERKTFGTSFVPPGRAGQPNNRNFDLQRMSGEARMDVRPQDGMELISTIGMTKLGKGIELTGANGSVQAENWTYLNLQQRFRWNRLFSQVFLNNSNAGNDTLTSTTGTYLLRSGAPIVDKSRVFGAQIQHGFDMAGDKQTFTYGGDYIWTNPRTGHTINGANEDIDNVTEYGAYVQSSTKPTKQTEILFAARGDANTVIKGAFFSPRAALIFKPTETQNIRFTYNRAFATPANFSFFLDLINTPNIGGSGYDLKALGNPPKTGFKFRTGCAGSAIGDYCMKSQLVNGGEYTPISAAAAYPTLLAANAGALTAGIGANLKTSLAAYGVSATQAATIAQQVVAALVAGRPSNAQIPTRVSLINAATTALGADALQPISPLAASFNNTYEIGYKAIVGQRVRFDISGWRQQRGDVGTSAALSTPNVFADGAALGAFIGGVTGANLQSSLAPILAGNGLTAAQIGQVITGAATAIASSTAGSLARAPLGVVTFDSRNSKANEIYAVYKNTNKKLWVTGLDFAVDVVATDRLTFDANYSYSNKNVFDNIDGGNGAPLMSNSPKNRGSVGSRMNSGQGGWGGELRVRYTDPFPVNSGVYATNVAFPIATGQPGAVAVVDSKYLGYGKCPVADGTGVFCYKGVPTSITLDAQITKKFDLGARRFMFSINATNLLDRKLNTFVGTPEIGRLVLTRLQYSF
ncbi:MAG: TonB-dependent receptor [Gemmatimonadota bacterium]|nr:TonB-dependent receptor [Gemmatimonadota bacterium]